MAKIDFNSLSKREQKIAIAKDVIAQIKKGKYKPVGGGYIFDWKFNDGYRAYYAENDDKYRNQSVQKFLPKVKSCTVCALGACMLSVTKYKNKLHFEDIGSCSEDFTSSALALLKSVFTTKELAIIEALFEGFNLFALENYDYELSDGDMQICKDFNFETDGLDRIRLIMEHIVQNNGSISLAKIKKSLKATV